MNELFTCLWTALPDADINAVVAQVDDLLPQLLNR